MIAFDLKRYSAPVDLQGCSCPQRITIKPQNIHVAVFLQHHPLQHEHALVCAFLEPSHTHSLGRGPALSRLYFSGMCQMDRSRAELRFDEVSVWPFVFSAKLRAFQTCERRVFLNFIAPIFAPPCSNHCFFANLHAKRLFMKEDFLQPRSMRKHWKTQSSPLSCHQAFCGRQIQNWMFQHACIPYTCVNINPSRQHQTSLACNFTAFSAMFLRIRDDFVPDEAISNAC